MTQKVPRKSRSGNRPAIAGGIVVILLLVAGGYFYLSRHVVQISGAMPREAYILRPNWSDALLKTISDHGSEFDELVVVAGEVDTESGSAQYSVNPLNYKWMADHHLRIGALIVINDPPGIDAAAAVQNCAQDILKKASDGGLAPVELQLDFAAAPSQLTDYQKWLQQLRSTSSIPISIVLSPQMLSNGFASAAGNAGSFVLRATGDNDSLLRGVQVVARFGIPFRIVLLSSTAHSSPAQMADLMHSLIDSRPRFLQTAIWNNVSSDDDYSVWNFKCLDAVMNGITPQPDVELSVRIVEKNLSEVDLVNKGTADAPFSSPVSVTWNDADLVGAQPLPDFDRADTGRRSMVFTPQSTLAAKPIRPGEQRAIGWVRLTDDSEIRAQVQTPAQ